MTRNELRDALEGAPADLIDRLCAATLPDGRPLASALVSAECEVEEEWWDGDEELIVTMRFPIPKRRETIG